MDGVHPLVTAAAAAGGNVRTRPAPTLVRIRAGRAANKRRSWHAARIADDIQRSLATVSPGQSPLGETKARSASWHPSHDCSLPSSSPSPSSYHATVEARTAPGSAVCSSKQKEEEVAPPPSAWPPLAQTSGVSFSIASWLDRPLPPFVNEMDNLVSHLGHTKPTTSSESRVRHFLWPEHAAASNSNRGSVDSVDGDFSPLNPPPRLVPVTLRRTATTSNSNGEMQGDEGEEEADHRRIASSLSNNFIDVVVKELRGAPPHLHFPSVLVYPLRPLVSLSFLSAASPCLFFSYLICCLPL